MINFSIDYLTRKDGGSEAEEGTGRSPLPTTMASLSPGSVSSDMGSPENGQRLSPSLSPNSTSGLSSAKDNGSDKPSHSYIALISMAILNSQEKKVLLGDIYQYIMDSFPYYNNKKKAWRNSIRHNLSLNECFIKSGRADNGKGNYWSIHPACIEDFSHGDFRRRQARRRARKSVMPEVNVSELPMSYRCNLGYVPMTSSTLSSSISQSAAPSSNYYPTTSYTVNPMSSGLSYYSLNGSATTGYMHPINNTSSSQYGFSCNQNPLW